MRDDIEAASQFRVAPSPRHVGWLSGLRTYLGVIGLGNLVWEAAHLPLYTIWKDGSTREKLIAVVHCTGGDLLIGLSTLVLAVVLAGRPEWPNEGFRRIALLTIVFATAYTVFSEWLNIIIRRSWAYSDLMPVIPLLGTGLSPMLEWLFMPLAALWLARRNSTSSRTRPEQ